MSRTCIAKDDPQRDGQAEELDEAQLFQEISCANHSVRIPCGDGGGVNSILASTLKSNANRRVRSPRILDQQVGISVNLSRSALRIVAVAGLVLLSFGCSEESPVAPPAPVDTGSEIETNLTDPTAVIAAHARALAERNFPAYVALIDEAFEFYPRFVGYPGPSRWGRAEELQMIERLLDEEYFETVEDVVVLEGAETVRFEATVLDIRPIENDQVEVHCACRGYVVTSPADMYVFRSRQLFTLIPRDGYLRIRKIVESEEPGVPQWKSWGTVKAYYN